MDKLKFLTLLLLGTLSAPALAYSCVEFKERVEVRINGMEDRRPDADCIGKLGELLAKPAVFYFQSPGGNIDRIQKFVDGMTKIFAISLKRSGVIPIVVVHKECKSACVPILAGFNQLAKENKIVLIVDPRTKIGFHGCSDNYAGDPLPKFTIEGTNRYLKYFVQLGASLDWITAHISLFETPAITDFSPEDIELADSGFLTEAKFAIYN